MSRKFWIIVASRDHVLEAVRQGIAQAGHGKKKPLERMIAGDILIYYSGKESLQDKSSYQKFTAIGKLTEKEIYQVTINEKFKPFRRNARYFTVSELSIRPLINELDFISNKKTWGFPFRVGMLEIGQKDFERIASGMLTKENLKECLS